MFTLKHRVKRPLSFLATYKQHNLFLLGALLLMLVFIYTINIKRSVQMYEQYQSKLVQIARASNASKEVAQLKTQLANLKQNSLQAYDRELLLSHITGFCRKNDLLVRAFPKALQNIENGNAIVTNTIEVEGNYKEIVRLVYMIEQEEKLASISSLKLFSEKDRRTKQIRLRARLILRNLGA